MEDLAEALQLYLTPLQRRVALGFFEKPPGTILVGKAKLVAPFDEHQFLLRSGFYQRMVEDNQPPAKHILDQFEIPSLEDPTFLKGWLIANGVIPLPLPQNKEFENIYCEYLLIDGYVPPKNPDRIAPPKNPEHETKQLQRTIQEFETERQLLDKVIEETAERELAEWIATMNLKLQNYMAECRAEGHAMNRNLTFTAKVPCKDMSDALVTKLREHGFKVKKDFDFSTTYQLSWEPFPSRRCVIM